MSIDQACLRGFSRGTSTVVFISKTPAISHIGAFTTTEQRWSACVCREIQPEIVAYYAPSGV
jgi:hypothetical protein